MGEEDRRSTPQTQSMPGEGAEGGGVVGAQPAGERTERDDPARNPDAADESARERGEKLGRPGAAAQGGSADVGHGEERGTAGGPGGAGRSIGTDKPGPGRSGD